MVVIMLIRKVRMRAFLKSIDERVYVNTEKGWTATSTTVAGIVTPIDISTWTEDELADCDWNSREVHAIFMAISFEEFKWVSMCKIATEAWNILETTYEGIETVRNLKLHILPTKFEEIRKKNGLLIYTMLN